MQQRYVMREDDVLLSGNTDEILGEPGEGTVGGERPETTRWKHCTVWWGVIFVVFFAPLHYNIHIYTCIQITKKNGIQR